MKRRANAPRTSWQIFKWPLVMAVANIVGVISALIGEGLLDALSWAALGGTLVLMILAWRGRSA